MLVVPAGAKEVISADESQLALDIAKRNFEKNNIDTPASFLKADVFKLLESIKSRVRNLI